MSPELVAKQMRLAVTENGEPLFTSDEWLDVEQIRSYLSTGFAKGKKAELTDKDFEKLEDDAATKTAKTGAAVYEELTRISSHYAEFDELLPQPVGLSLGNDGSTNLKKTGQKRRSSIVITKTTHVDDQLRSPAHKRTTNTVDTEAFSQITLASNIKSPSIVNGYLRLFNGGGSNLCFANSAIQLLVSCGKTLRDEVTVYICFLYLMLDIYSSSELVKIKRFIFSNDGRPHN